MNANFINELLDVLDTTGANLSTRGGILDLIEKNLPKDEPQEQQSSTTKESIMAIKNPVERIRAIRDNPALFGAANTHNELENKFQD